MGGSSDEEGAARYPRVDYSAPPAGKPGVELREVDETPLASWPHLPHFLLCCFTWGPS